ncbi:MAG: hypothetical protein JOZ22_21040 [Acidobacteriia bacterium]|nr:hypothetical protein [Terriglobia bacterium]
MLRPLHYISFVGLAVLAAGCQRQQASVSAAAIDSSKYYAVLLNNNSVYFGKLEGLGSEFPVLHDVYYVQSNVNQETKQVNNLLVKRGKEWHGPDRMILSEKSIVFVEPVGPTSKVAQLITESKK